MGSPSDAFGLLKMGNSVTRSGKKAKDTCPSNAAVWLEGWGALGGGASRAAVRRGGWAGVHLYDAEQAAAEPAGHPPFRSCGGNAAFSALPPLSFPLLFCLRGKHKYCKNARCPGVWKDGGVQHDTFRCIVIVRSARKGSKTLLGEKDDRKTVQGIHRCRMSYGSGGVRYAGYFMGMGIGRAALQHIHARL